MDRKNGSNWPILKCSETAFLIHLLLSPADTGLFLIHFLRELSRIKVNSKGILYISKRKIINSTQYP